MVMAAAETTAARQLYAEQYSFWESIHIVFFQRTVKRILNMGSNVSRP